MGCGCGETRTKILLHLYTDEREPEREKGEEQVARAHYTLLWLLGAAAAVASSMRQVNV